MNRIAPSSSNVKNSNSNIFYEFYLSKMATWRSSCWTFPWVAAYPVLLLKISSLGSPPLLQSASHWLASVDKFLVGSFFCIHSLDGGLTHVLTLSSEVPSLTSSQPPVSFCICSISWKIKGWLRYKLFFISNLYLCNCNISKAKKG